MKGGIYSDERCPICKRNFVDNWRTGLQCPKHPKQWATKFRIKFGKLTRRYNSYREAQEVLWTWRREEAEGTFNPKDHMTSNPSGFEKLGEKFLAIKRFDLRPEGYRRYLYHYKTCADALGETSVRHIDYTLLEDLKFELLARLAPKTVYDTFGFLRTFLVWCLERRELKKLPRFPKLSKKMGMRKILDKATQTRVLEKVYELYWKSVPRACVGIEFLCTYPKIRPGELRQVQEKNIDLKNATLTIPRPKERDDPKGVMLLQKHVELIRSLPAGLPELYFLRYDYPVKGRRVGQRLGRDYLYNAWRKSCAKLGVEGVPLYPGTKHTTASDLARKFPERLVKQTTGHTSKAFERYLVLGEEDCVTLYEEASPKVKRAYLSGSRTDLDRLTPS